jgi:hypothetical protein
MIHHPDRKGNTVMIKDGPARGEQNPTGKKSLYLVASRGRVD